MGDDTLELFRGELLDGERTQRVLGRVRVPCWQLLSAGVVMRAHACCMDELRFLEPAEACDSIHELNTSVAVRACAMRAWTTLISDLRALGVSPVYGELPDSAYSIWRGSDAEADNGSSDGGVQLGERDGVEALAARIASGDCTAADEWAAAYQHRVPQGRRREARVRDMAEPTQDEVCGVPTRYVMPAEGGGARRALRGSRWLSCAHSTRTCQPGGREALRLPSGRAYTSPLHSAVLREQRGFPLKMGCND
jgi:hypothetical protein